MKAVRDLIPFPRSVMADPLAFGGAFPGITILVIDPHEDDRRYYAKGLRSSSTGYLVLEAGDGRAGLDLYRTHRIDCVVLELFLPDMDVLDLLAGILPVSHQPTVAVVALARSSSAALADIAMLRGTQACLRKSETSTDILERTIRTAMSAVISHRTISRSDSLPLN